MHHDCRWRAVSLPKDQGPPPIQAHTTLSNGQLCPVIGFVIFLQWHLVSLDNAPLSSTSSANTVVQLSRDWNDQFQRTHHCISIVTFYFLLLIEGKKNPHIMTTFRLTILRVFRPTAPAGRIPLGPCSNTPPSDLLVDHSQPPKRLLDSSKMTLGRKPQTLLTFEGSRQMEKYSNSGNGFVCYLSNLGAFAKVVRCCQSPDAPSQDRNSPHWLNTNEK